MNTKIIKLDINRRLYDKIVAKQDDTKSRFLLFQLLDGAVPFNLTDRSVRVYGVKPDGAVIFNDLTVTHSTTGFCLLELTNQMLAIAGTVKLELMITEGDKKLTSIPFEMEVIKKINSNAAVESSNEFRALLNALKEIDDWNREFADKSGKLEELYTPRLNELGSQLETIEAEKIDKNRSRIIFMPIADTENTAGDCSVIISKNGKVIMIDTGAVESYNLIRQNLKKYGVSKIDYMIISHYHSDHCSNLDSLINDFDMTKTIYYLQKHTPKFRYSDDYVLNLIQDNTVIYPNNNEVLNVDELKFTFFNCDQDDINYYDENSTNYNDYSMCCYCESYDTKVLFTGDIHLKAQSRLNEMGYFKKVDLLKVEHHAYDTTVNHDYIRKVNPRYGVVSESEKALTKKINIISETLSLLNGLGCDIAWCGKETVVFNFNEYGNEFVHDYSIGGCFKDVSNYIFIYVDSEYNDFSDGTFHNPFRTIREALNEASKIRGLNVQICPKKETFVSDEHIRIANSNVTLKLDNITVRGFDVRNSHIILGNFTVIGTHNRAVMIESSIVEFKDLTVNGDCRSATTEYDGRGVTVYKSKFIGTNLNISNKRIALGAHNNSEVYIENLTGVNNEYGILCANGSRIINNKVTMEYITPFKDLQKTSYIDGALKNDLTRYLVEGDDLNTLLTPGTRFVSKTGDITKTLLNIPQGLGYSFVMEVKKQTEDGSLMQIIKSRHLNNVNATDNKTGIFIRTFNYTDEWSNWYEISLK